MHRIAVPGIDEPLHERHHLRDMPGGTRFVGRRKAPQNRVCLVELALIAHRDNPVVGVLVLRVVDDLVVDVGDIAHERHGESGCLEPATKNIEGDAGAHMADVRWRLDRRPA